jgi:hypothetical protein
MNYKKLSELELKRVYFKLKAYFQEEDEEISQFRAVVSEYYPRTADSVLVKFDSEFTDEEYFFLVRSVVVYDKQGAELQPLPGKDLEAEDEFQSFEFENSDKPRDDIAFNMIGKGSLPDLYEQVK